MTTHPTLYALFVVYIMVCIALFAFLGMVIATSDGFGSGLAIMAIPFVPLWPLAIPFYAYVRYHSWVRDTNEQSARAHYEQQTAKMNAEAEVKAKEQADAAAREKVVAQVTEAKTAATTVPTEPAVAPATEPAK